ncbi:50S ribosomal protein L29 [Spiroplasma floricola 23-6]|uniref:Large ribosomal subunit protein uL29 n=1 Tax=Spiroplasma floricola 23-6 TaxID=1336749 RepID=A0A2K8SFQ9_9MOLU|nr:50S ribosomal protein L29 [Spiroplasma floricola]AUB32088.1 50S ribosomal protein L29 [Spiroplasma floricola 23-6]
MSKSVDFMMELRTKSIEDLIKLGEDRRAELFALKFQVAVGSLEQTHRIPALKKDIARIEMLLGERKRTGENINQTIKANYSQAVENAEKAGKEVRKKHKEMIEKLQQEQFGSQNDVSEDAIMAAMENAVNESKIEEETVKKVEPKKEAAPKVEVKKAEVKKAAASKPEVKKAEPKKEAAPKVEVKKAEPKKEATPKVEVKKAEPKKVAATTKVESKVKKPEIKETVIKPIKTGEAVPTGKGKKSLQGFEMKPMKVGVAKGEGIEGIDLKLSGKPKDAKTYTFGSNAQEAKKQIEEANKKAAEKKLLKKATTKGAK